MKKIILTLFISAQTLFSYSQCAELFISEYIEGNSNNKAIEIYNPTNLSVPLATLGYQIKIYSNGATTPTGGTISLTGTIAPGGTYIVANPSANAAVLAVADQTSGSLSFNGNDAVELFRTFDGASIDIVGEIGVNPGPNTEWLLNGSSGTLNHTLVRKQTVQQPNLVWTGSGELEWDIYPVDDFTHLDAHTMNACGPTPLSTDFTFSNVCFGTVASFNSTSTGGDGNYTYAWDFGDGSGTSTLEDPTYMYTAAGTYTVNLVVTDGTPTTTNASYSITIYDKPVVTSTPDVSSGCAPLTVCFTTNVTGGTPTYTYLWSTGSTTQNPCEVLSSSGNIELIVTDQNGCKDTVSNAITVNPLDDASFNYSAASYCESDGLQYPTITGLSGGVFSGAGIGNASNGEFNCAVGGGNYAITYTTNGACPNSSVVNISVTTQPDATITPAGPFCESDASVNLMAADGGGTWSGTGITDSNLGTFDPGSSGPGSFSITYTITGSCGIVNGTTTIDVNNTDDASFNYSAGTVCINDASVIPTITGLTGGTFSSASLGLINTSTGEFDPAAAGPGCVTITYTTNGTCPNFSDVTICVTPQTDATITATGPFCENDASVNLTAVDGGGTWSGTGITDANNGTFDPATAGVGMHTITYTISGSCGATDTEVIEVNANANVVIYNNDTTICNDIFGFFLNAEAGGTWSGDFVNDSGNGDGFFSSAAILPGTYYAVYTISGQCGDKDSIAIDVYDYPMPAFTYSSSLGDVTFTDGSTNAVTYFWDFDDGNNSTAQNPMHTFALNGTYNVCLTVSNAVGCENTTCQTITITGLGIEQNSKVDFKVYPNPSNGNLAIESNSTITKISVKDLIGQTVFNQNTSSSNARISLEEINNGFYFIEIETEKGKAIKRIEIIK